ncbi:hypothetical protein HNR59_003953 [Aquamicrobium lusatiense]|uniref:Uncharacterized protein n=1 Tax=Aquamicrobium lusatiense TaxID=89772 RepID=A0A7W9S7S9_9HYPH|nr:hypothetical protein [Aquamicrobium lusatiense]
MIIDSSGTTSRCAKIAAITLRNMSVVSRRSRFLVKTGPITGNWTV